ncbi:MAG: GspH/FimT family protein [Desulfobacterales bacterium]|nr:GspH/FimT family protein [Desulfobacterales bacterium]
MIRGDLETARSRAIRENAPAAVVLREDGYSIFIDNGAGGGIPENWVRDGGEKLLFSRSLPQGLKIDLNHVTFENKRTRFNGRGYVANSGELVVADRDGRSVKLDMNNRFGRIHSQ